MSDLTENELLALLQDAGVDTGPDDAYTTHELAERLGWSIGKVRRALRPLAADNKVQCVKVRRTRLDGLSAPVPAYRFVA